MQGESIYVVSMGASTPIGRDPFSSAAAVRAGISGFAEHPFMIDTAGEPMRIAKAPWIDISINGAERFKALLLPAINQALAVLPKQQSSPLRIGFVLVLPSERPGLPETLQPALIEAFRIHYQNIFCHFAVMPHGHAGGLMALQEAIKQLWADNLDACLVAGVDSYLEPETLEWLEDCDQLHGAGPLNNAWGFIPGEAASAVLVMGQSVMQRCQIQALARIVSVGSAFEPKRIKTETVCIGEGLTQAFRSALQSLPAGVKISDVYCDMNGEPYRGDEYGFTCLRTNEYFVSASDFIAPADCWGDVCAASTLLYLQLATIAGIKSYANGHLALLWASSEAGDRAAAVIEVRRAG